MDITKGQMRSKIADKILSETPQETRDHTKDYWKGRSDQYEIDSAELTRLRSELQRKDAVINELVDVLDFYYSHGYIHGTGYDGNNEIESIIKKAKLNN